LSLLNVKQERGESLRAFMDRFNKVCRGIRNFECGNNYAPFGQGDSARLIH